ncbi:hypothetical protein [Amycolatopsis magusensis]|uniref:hypothetical protein n=1 Tax=Amycolatopsis magusensis TaxID=882444 RepID=UPI0037AE4057
MRTDYRGLGFDPAPGSPDAVMAAAERCARAAARLPGLPSGPAGWTGTAAEGFGRRLAEVPGEVTAAGKALHAAATILDEWAGTLLANRRRAEQLDHRALRLKRSLLTASDEVDSATVTAQFSTAPGVEAQRHAAVARHEQLTRELERVLQAAHLLERDHLAEAERVTVRLRTVDSEGAEAAARVPGRAELFGGVGVALAAQSAFAADLAATVLRPAGARAEPELAAGAFAAALAR